MNSSAIREALVWTLPALMAGMLAGTMGMLVYQLVADTGVPDTANTVFSLLVTLVIWFWAMRLVVVQRHD